MAGLLDMDPREYGVTQGLLGMGSALLTPVARGGGFAGVGPALMSAQANAMQMAEAQRAAKQREEEMAMRRQQFDLQLKDWQTKQAEVERQRAIEQQLGDAARQSFIPGQAQIDGTADPSRFDMAAFGQRALQIDPTGRGLAIYQSSQKDNTPITLKEGESLIDRQTLRPIFSQPKAAAPTELARLTAERDQYPVGHPLRKVYDNAIQKATTHQPAANTTVITGQKDLFKYGKDLRDEFNGLPETKAFKEVQTAYDQISGALKNPSPANDLAAATKFMKMLDPGSVVRESELGMAMSATGLMDRVQNYAGMLVRGEKLTPQQREDFRKSTEQLYRAAEARHSSNVNKYRTFAQTYGLNPDEVATTPVNPQAGKPRGPIVVDY